MDKREELDLFLERADEFIDSKYILADVKIINLLKAIAATDTILALFKNCLTDFDYDLAKKKYLVKSPYLAADKGEFVLPESSRELLAFVFNILVDLDAKRLVLSDFLNKYFYENGSCYAGYNAFITSMIKPFKNTVKALMESVIDGKVQDPVEAFSEEEARRLEQKKKADLDAKKDEELSKKAYGESVKKIKALLLEDKKKIKDSRLSDEKKEELILVGDMLANVIESEDLDAINYAFISYKYVAKAHKILYFGRERAISKLIKDVKK